MFYNRTNWLARLGTGLNRFRITPSGDHAYIDSEPEEITQQGTQFSPANMNNIEDFVEILSNHVLTQDIEVFVDMGGDDNNNGLTEATAKKSIQAALNAIPKMLGGHSAIITILSNYTTGAVSIFGYVGGSVTIRNKPEAYGIQAEIGSINIQNCTRVNIDSSNGAMLIIGGENPTTAIEVRNAELVLTISADASIAIEEFTTSGILASYGGSVHRYPGTGELRIIPHTKAGAYGVQASVGGYVYLHQVSITNAQTGMRAYAGGIIAYGTRTDSGVTTANTTLTGGRIYSGAQSNVPNY